MVPCVARFALRCETSVMGKRRKPSEDDNGGDDVDGDVAFPSKKSPFMAFGASAPAAPGNNTSSLMFGAPRPTAAAAGGDGDEEDDENVKFSFMPKKDTMMERRALFVQHLKALNSQFLSWLNGRMDASGGVELWTDGVKDYLRHSEKLRIDFKDVLEQDSIGTAQPKMTSSMPTAGTAPAVHTFGGVGAFGAPPASQEAKKVDADKPKPALVNPAAATGSIFGSNGGAGTIFGGPKLGSLTAPAAASAFGAPGTVAGNGAAPFSFGGGSSAFPPAAPAAAADAEEEEPQRPPSPSVAEAEGGDDFETLFSSRAKMYHQVKKDGGTEWKDLGVGDLSVRRQKEGEPKPRICLRNSGGKLRLNSNIYKGIDVTIKKNMIIAQLQYSGGDAEEPKLEMIMLRQKTEELSNKLAEVIKENAPQ